MRPQMQGRGLSPRPAGAPHIETGSCFSRVGPARRAGFFLPSEHHDNGSAPGGRAPHRDETLSCMCGAGAPRRLLLTLRAPDNGSAPGGRAPHRDRIFLLACGAGAPRRLLLTLRAPRQRKRARRARPTSRQDLASLCWGRRAAPASSYPSEHHDNGSAPGGRAPHRDKTLSCMCGAGAPRQLLLTLRAPRQQKRARRSRPTLSNDSAPGGRAPHRDRIFLLACGAGAPRRLFRALRAPRQRKRARRARPTSRQDPVLHVWGRRAAPALRALRAPRQRKRARRSRPTLSNDSAPGGRAPHRDRIFLLACGAGAPRRLLLTLRAPRQRKRARRSRPTSRHYLASLVWGRRAAPASSYPPSITTTEARPAGAPHIEEPVARAPRAPGQRRKPMSVLENCARLGNTVASDPPSTPNHRASVAPYSSTAVVGIHRPSFEESSGPASASVGNEP